MAKGLAQCAALMLVVAVATRPAAAAAAGPESTSAPIALEFDTQRVEPELGARIGTQLTEQLAPKLDELGYVVSTLPGVPTVLGIRVTGFDAEHRDYEVELELQRPSAAPVREVIVCNACGESRLVSQVLAEASGLLESEPEPEPEPESAEPESKPVEFAPPQAPLGPLGLGGGALGAIGIMVASVGIQRLARGKLERRSDYSFRTETFDYRPIGATALVLGGGALIAGIILVVLDLKPRWAKERGFAFEVSPTFVGFQAKHRF